MPTTNVLQEQLKEVRDLAIEGLQAIRVAPLSIASTIHASGIDSEKGISKDEALDKCEATIETMFRELNELRGRLKELLCLEIRDSIRAARWENGVPIKKKVRGEPVTTYTESAPLELSAFLTGVFLADGILPSWVEKPLLSYTPYLNGIRCCKETYVKLLVENIRSYIRSNTDSANTDLQAEIHDEYTMTSAWLEDRGGSGSDVTPNAGETLPPARHSPDFRSVHWFGAGYAFTDTQAACVRELWESWENGTPEVADQTLLKIADVADGQKLRHVFRENPAWKTMILEGTTKGTHQILPPA